MLTERLKLRFIALAIALTAAAALTQTAQAGGLKAGDALPDLAAFKLEGKVPESMKGKVVMLDFWASWCNPCQESFPVMDGLQKKYESQGFLIIAVNVDEKRSDMEDFLKKNAVSFAVVRDAAQKLVEKAGIATMPSSLLVDRDGKVRFVHSGFKGKETQTKYEQEIESLLKK